MIINFQENKEKKMMKNIHLTLQDEQITKLETFSKYYDMSKSEIIRQVINELELPNQEKRSEYYSERLQL